LLKKKKKLQIRVVANCALEFDGATALLFDWQMSKTSWLHHQSKVCLDFTCLFVLVSFG